MKFKNLLAMAVAVLLLTACEDLFEDGSLQPDGSVPYLSIKKPTAKQMLKSSGNLRIVLTASDKDMVKELNVRVRDVGGDADWVNFTIYPDKKVLEYDTLLQMNNFRKGDYLLTISATDNRTNLSKGEVEFSLQ